MLPEATPTNSYTSAREANTHARHNAPAISCTADRQQLVVLNGSSQIPARKGSVCKRLSVTTTSPWPAQTDQACSFEVEQTINNKS